MEWFLERIVYFQFFFFLERGVNASDICHSVIMSNWFHTCVRLKKLQSLLSNFFILDENIRRNSHLFFFINMIKTGYFGRFLKRYEVHCWLKCVVQGVSRNFLNVRIQCLAHILSHIPNFTYIQCKNNIEPICLGGVLGKSWDLAFLIGKLKNLWMLIAVSSGANSQI